jgi:FixJ family two-component response regulator
MTANTESTIQTSEAVYIVDDDASICEGLCNLLEAVGIRAEAYSSAEAILENWSESNAGCMLLDARLPGMSGVEFQEQMQKLGIGMPVIFMTAHGDVPMVRKVMKAGAVEFLTKPFQKEELLHAIDQAFAFDRERRQDEEILNSIKTRMDTLTGREREVMERVTAGLLNKQIAAELNLSEITVKLYRRQVMDKMQAGSLADLVKLYERVRVASRTSGDRA